MNTTLKLLTAAIITVLLVSCGGGDKATDSSKLDNKLVKDSEITKILKKKAVMYVKADSFEGVNDPSSESFSISNVVISADMNCVAEGKLCEEISSFFEGNELVFKSSEEYGLVEEMSSEYRTKQKGTVEVNGNTYIGTLYYSGESNNEVGSWFKGKLIFDLPAVKSLKGESLILEIKGKK